MQLTLDQAAARLGKSRRQVVYMIRQNRLAAKKTEGRWTIDADNLPIDETRQPSIDRKEREFKNAVETALDVVEEDEALIAGRGMEHAVMSL